MKKLFALILALTLVLSLAACGDKAEPATTAAPEDTTAETVADTEAATDASLEESVTGEDVSATEAVSENTEETETAEAAGEKPETTAEVLDYYKEAMAKVTSKKVSFKKNRETGNEVYNAGLALKAFKSTVFKFMGIGSENIYARDVAKGDDSYSKYIKECKLTEADITSAECAVSGKDYIVTIKVKGGSSSVTDGGSYKNNSPIDRSGVSVGENDKDYYDHKTAQNVFDAIDEIAGGATIKESYSNAVVKATIDSETGNLKSLTVTFDISFDISKVMGSSGTATGTTTVKFFSFGW